MLIEAKHHVRIAWEQHHPYVGSAFFHLEAPDHVFHEVFHFLEVSFSVGLDASRTINEEPEVHFAIDWVGNNQQIN